MSTENTEPQNKIIIYEGSSGQQSPSTSKISLKASNCSKKRLVPFWNTPLGTVKKPIKFPAFCMLGMVR